MTPGTVERLAFSLREKTRKLAGLPADWLKASTEMKD